MSTACTNANSVLAALAHSDLKEGECVIKLNDTWIVCGIQSMQVKTGLGSYTEVELTGIVKYQD